MAGKIKVTNCNFLIEKQKRILENQVKVSYVGYVCRWRDIHSSHKAGEDTEIQWLIVNDEGGGGLSTVIHYWEGTMEVFWCSCISKMSGIT